MKHSLVFVPVLVLVTGCSSVAWLKGDRSDSQHVMETPVAASSVHNSQNSLDWWGDYRGMLPCADCEAIETYVRINRDLSYKIKTRYLGKSDKFYQEMGSFSWTNNGSDIVLGNDPTLGVRFRVLEGRLIQTDMVGEPLDKEDPDKYQLTQFRH